MANKGLKLKEGNWLNCAGLECAIVSSLRVNPNNTPNIQIKQQMNSFCLIVSGGTIFQVPSVFIGTGHSNHDGSGPGQ